MNKDDINQKKKTIIKTLNKIDKENETAYFHFFKL